MMSKINSGGRVRLDKNDLLIHSNEKYECLNIFDSKRLGLIFLHKATDRPVYPYRILYGFSELFFQTENEALDYLKKYKDIRSTAVPVKETRTFSDGTTFYSLMEVQKNVYTPKEHLDKVDDRLTEMYLECPKDNIYILRKIGKSGVVNNGEDIHCPHCRKSMKDAITKIKNEFIHRYICANCDNYEEDYYHGYLWAKL